MADKSLGQHWLFDTHSLRAMCEAVDVREEDTVLEIGPGLGFLTRFLLERGYQVTALEKDRVLAGSLENRLNHSGLRVVEGDALEADPKKIGVNGAFAVAGVAWDGPQAPEVLEPQRSIPPGARQRVRYE